MRLPAIILFFLISFLSSKAMISHLVNIKPIFPGYELSQEDLNHFKITIFNSTRSDSLLIPRYNNCLIFKGKLPQYNGEFILYDKQIPFTSIKVEHPKFITSFYTLNKTVADLDSIDVFNKRHHILIHNTVVELEQECPEEKNFHFQFWSDKQPKGGFIYENLIGALFNDSLSTDSLKSIGNSIGLTFKDKSYTGKRVLFQLQKGKVKTGKNKSIIALLNDSNRIKDAGLIIDSAQIIFFSSFCKIHALPITSIEKWGFEPISGLKSMTSSMNYIKSKELEMGCGLYRHTYGIGMNIINWQKQSFLNELNDRCSEQKQLLKNDKDYVTLHTKTLSISGGKDKGNKKISNIKKMTEIHESDKELNKEYKAPYGYIEPILISTE